jgi:hypothetical protein
MDFKEAIHEYAEVPLPLQVIKNLLKGYKRPYSHKKRALYSWA